ncbi:MAG: cupin domain-containing protein [Gammaproteobacteria bacterium]|nr:cupin domain-containing protein [Gammaproteobacteria bacterium]
MHADDVGKVCVPGSRREGLRLRPNYAMDEDGVDTVKVLLITDNTLMFEAFRPKGASDRAHMHPDHDSLCYQKSGRVRMRIGDESFIVEPGDAYFHPLGVIHQHEALEDSVRIEIKTFPKGGAVAAWNALVGDSLPR